MVGYQYLLSASANAVLSNSSQCDRDFDKRTNANQIQWHNFLIAPRATKNTHAVGEFLMGLNALVPLLLAVAVAADPEVAWNITGCSQNPAPCRQGVTDTRECEVVCFENRTCEIRVALIFPNDTGYIVNLQAVICWSCCVRVLCRK